MGEGGVPDGEGDWDGHVRWTGRWFADLAGFWGEGVALRWWRRIIMGV